MNRKPSGTNQRHAQLDFGRGELQLIDEVTPLPDWSRIGRHILAEAMRRAMARMNARLAGANPADVDAQAKELS